MSSKRSDEKSPKSRSKQDTGMNVRPTESLDSTASVSIGTTGRFTATETAPKPETELITTYGQNLFDSICLMIWCPKHKKTCLTKISEKKGFFFPITPVTTGQSWFDGAESRLKEVLRVEDSKSNKPYLSHSPPSLLQLFRLQIPDFMDFVTRVTYISELTFNPKHPTNCCTDSAEVRWVSSDDITGQRIAQLWGKEVEVLVDGKVNNALNELNRCVEYTVLDSFLYSPKDKPKSWQDELIQSAKFTEEDIKLLWSEFFQHSYPSQYLSQFSFEEYISQLGFPQMFAGFQFDPKSLFRAFTLQPKNFLTFHEFILGFCAIDRRTPHSGRCRQLRSGYIFRYYNRFGTDKCLNTDDITLMAKDMIRSRSNGQLDETKVDSEVKVLYLAITGSDSRNPIKENAFIKAIGDRKLTGSSGLFRAATYPIQQIRVKRVYDTITLDTISAAAIGGKAQNIKGTCLRCRQKKYGLAVHTVKLSKDGLILDPQENKGQSDTKVKSKQLRRMSQTSFSSSSSGNYFLEVIRNFSHSGAITGLSTQSINKSLAEVWSYKNQRISSAEKILKLLEECESIFKKEPTVIKVSSPVFVLGDIHGNLHDLMIYETNLWKLGPTCVTSSFLFLGDYVDRGEYSVECVLYLMATKVVSPEKFWLLRGNHEIKSVNGSFSFRDECHKKFDEELGNTLWEAFNRVFDLMPICAIIDESIFCAHGGIPAHALRTEELIRIPKPLTDPESQSKAAWEIFWNDPITTQEFNDFSKMVIQNNENIEIQGFLRNTKRGTAYYFSDQALKEFLSANQLSHIIRAHEVIPNGYAFHMGGKCITIFSSSRYCGDLNEAAVLLVDNEKIRIIKVDTN